MGESSGPLELTPLGHSELGDTFLARRGATVCGVLKRFNRELSAEPSFRAALHSELSLAAQLRVPSAAAVLEQGELDGCATVLVQHIPGVTLAQLCRAARASGEWPLPIERAVALIGPVLQALGAAHALTPALLHRALCPENVRVTLEGQVVVTDFGLGRARLRVGGGSGVRGGYVSAEQARGLSTDARSEVFVIIRSLIIFGSWVAEVSPSHIGHEQIRPMPI